jgi:alanyl-tRNA synthetase
MNRADAEELGAMALFGEKYGEWVRVVEVDGVSRELCGGTHVANTAEVGIFKLTSEGSSAANVRRVEAITGPAAIDFFREREAQLREAGELLGNPQDPLAAARRAAEQLKQASAGAEKAQREQLGVEADDLSSATMIYGTKGSGKTSVIASLVNQSLQANPKQLLDLANRIQSKAEKPSVVVLGGEFGGKAGLVALVSKDAIEKGVSAGTIIREIAPIVGGGGGGRDDMAQAGGKDPSKLDEALAAARAAIERDLT